MSINLILDPDDSPGRDARVGRNADSGVSRRVTLSDDSLPSAEGNQLAKGKVALIMDIMGISIKSDETFTVVWYPAGTFKMVTDLLLNSRLRLNTEYVVYHLGTSLVMDFIRGDIIGKIIRLCQVTKQKYPTIKIYFDTLIPRPVDHELTGREIINLNDAIKTGTTVANRRYPPVNYISNHQCFVHKDSSYIKELYHKKELRLSRRGAKVLKDNIKRVLRL